MVVVFMRALDRRLAWSFVVLATCLAAWNLLLGLECMPWFRSNYVTLASVLVYFVILLPATIFHNGATWTGPPSTLVSFFTVAAYACGFGLCALQANNLVFDGFQELAWGAMGRPGPFLPVYGAFLVMTPVATLVLSVVRLRRCTDGLIALRTKYWLLAVGVALPLGVTNLLVNYGVAMLPLGSVGSLLSVGIFAYAATTHRLVEPVSLVVSGGAAGLAAAATIVPIGLVVLVAGSLPVGLAFSIVASCALIIVSAALALLPRVRRYLERGVEKSIFPARHAARQALRRFSGDLVQISRRDELCEQLVRVLVESLGVESAALYLGEGKRKTFELSHAVGVTDPPQQLSLSRVSGPRNVLGAADVTCAIDWHEYVPVIGDRGVIAVIALGSKNSGAAIDDSDRTLLSMVAAQLAVGLKNAEYVGEIEQQKDKIDGLRKKVEAENVVLRAEVRTHSQFSEIVGASTALRDTLECVVRVAPTDATILITGETGTGKELIARAIHDLSPRAQGPLICVNCPAIPVDIAESELFGHERGAYTGAVDTYPGKFEMANGGTIFLDEVADLPANVQTKLLRVLQEREVQRLGSHKIRSIDVRIVSATNRDLHEEIRRGRFREDLYFRLATVPVYVPSLRERIGDIGMLAGFFLERAATQYQKAIEGISQEGLSALSAYSWPGNIRELQHVIERAVLLCTSNVLGPEHLSDLGDTTVGAPTTLGEVMREEKLRRVREALCQTEGNQAAAARLLGMSRSNLARLIKRYGIDPVDFSS